MMDYYKYQDNLEGMAAVTYIEVAVHDVIRQITVTKDSMRSSNFKNSKYHFYLCETEIDISDKSYIMISKLEFDEVWSECMKRYLLKWENIKCEYKVGEKVRGCIEVFYPQGVIIEINDGILALADYDECDGRDSEGDLEIRRQIEGCVVGYDDTNMWIKISQVKLI